MLALLGVLVEEGWAEEEEEEEKGCLEGVVMIGVREGVVEEEEDDDEAAEPRRLGVSWKREGVRMVGRGGVLLRGTRSLLGPGYARDC